MGNTNASMSIGEATFVFLNFSIAFFLNLMMFVLVYHNRHLRTSFNLSVLNMCLADILVSINMIISTALTLSKGDFLTDTQGCTVTGLINILCFVASVMALAAVSLNRYFLVVHWRRYHKLFSIRNTLMYVSFVWIFSLLLVTPPLFGWGRFSFHKGKSICFADWKSSISYMLFMIGMCFGGPIASTLFSLYKILRVRRRVHVAANSDNIDKHSHKSPATNGKTNDISFTGSRTQLNKTYSNGSSTGSRAQLNKTYSNSSSIVLRGQLNKTYSNDSSISIVQSAPQSSTPETPAKTSKSNRQLEILRPFRNWTPKILRRRGNSDLRREKRQREEYRITISIAVIVVVFFVAWGPFVLVMFLETLGKLDVPRWADFGALGFGCLNSTANPIVYLTMNGNFRLALRSLWRQLCNTKADDLNTYSIRSLQNSNVGM